MRLKCLSFDRKLCQNVVFGGGWDFPACLCWSTSSSGHAVVQEPPGEGTRVGLHSLVPAAGFAWRSPSERLVASEQFVSLSSALIMKLRSIRGPSSLCDCRNYHLPNWCEVPRACPAPPARTIRQPRQRDAHEELLAPIVLKQRGNIARQGHFPMERALVASPYNFQWSVTCAQHLSHVPAPILSLLGTAVFGDRCQWGDDFCRTREKDGERLNLLGSTQWKQAWHLALRSLY